MGNEDIQFGSGHLYMAEKYLGGVAAISLTLCCFGVLAPCYASAEHLQLNYTARLSSKVYKLHTMLRKSHQRSHLSKADSIPCVWRLKRLGALFLSMNFQSFSPVCILCPAARRRLINTVNM